MQKFLVIITLLGGLGMLPKGLVAASQGDPVAQLSIAEVNEDPAEVGRYVIYADAAADLSTDVVSQIQKGAFVLVASKLFGPIAEGTIMEVAADPASGRGLRVEIVCRDVTKPPVLSNFVLVYGRESASERVDDPNAAFREMWEEGNIDGLRLLVDSLESDSSFSGYAALKRNLEMVVGFYAKFDDAVNLGKLEGYQALMVEFEGQKNRVPPPLYQKLSDLLAGYENSYRYIEGLMDDEDLGGALQAAEALQANIQSDQLNVLIRIVRERLNDASPLQDRVNELKQAREKKDWETVERLINELSTADIRNPLLINYIVECDKLLANYKKLVEEFIGERIDDELESYNEKFSSVVASIFPQRNEEDLMREGLHNAVSQIPVNDEALSRLRSSVESDALESFPGALEILRHRVFEMAIELGKTEVDKKNFSKAVSYEKDARALLLNLSNKSSSEKELHEMSRHLYDGWQTELKKELESAIESFNTILLSKSLRTIQSGDSRLLSGLDKKLLQKAEDILSWKSKIDKLNTEIEGSSDLGELISLYEKKRAVLMERDPFEQLNLTESKIAEFRAEQQRRVAEERERLRRKRHLAPLAEQYDRLKAHVAGGNGFSKKNAKQFIDWVEDYVEELPEDLKTWPDIVRKAEEIKLLINSNIVQRKSGGGAIF